MRWSLPDTPRAHRWQLVAAACCAVLAVVAVLTTTARSRDGQPDPHAWDAESGGAAAVTAPEAVFPAGSIDAALSRVVHRDLGTVKAPRLANGLAPPTNRWFSGLALGPTAQPVYPMPYSYTPTSDGFSFGVPSVSTQPEVITGFASSDVHVRIPGMTSATVTGYDDDSATVTLADSRGAVARVVLARGSPYLSLTALTPVTLETNLPFSSGASTRAASGRAYSAVTRGARIDGTHVGLGAGTAVTWFPVPDGGSRQAMADAAMVLTGTDLSYGVNSTTATTRITYRGNGTGAFGVLPHQTPQLATQTACNLGTIPTVFGTMRICQGHQLEWSTPNRPVQTQLPIDRLPATDRNRLAPIVRADIAASTTFPTDTYYGGKALQRLTQLWQLAEQLGLSQAAASAKSQLVGQLNQWTDPQGCANRSVKCFVYDDQARGLVGMAPSFGSEGFSDHHFHYGYFLYTAGILAMNDPALMARWRPVMDLVAADLASSGSGAFPDRRTFDPYGGQSWANGSTPLPDGNDQESTSEAINAWIGLDLWSKATHNQALSTQAQWMLAGETRAALRYGLYLDRADPVYRGYQHQIVSLTFGSKRGYQTWFSAEASAKLGIQLLPSAPASMVYLRSVPSALIRQEVQEATGTGGFSQTLSDYVLMYSALAGSTERDRALKIAGDPQWTSIDSGNSRAYLTAWILCAGLPT